MEQHKPVIRLWQLNGIGLIIAHPSGALYTNQTGGFACHHPRMEGVFVPLMDPEIHQHTALEAHFLGPKWAGIAMAGSMTRRRMSWIAFWRCHP